MAAGTLEANYEHMALNSLPPPEVRMLYNSKALIALMHCLMRCANLFAQEITFLLKLMGGVAMVKRFVAPVKEYSVRFARELESWAKLSCKGSTAPHQLPCAFLRLFEVAI